MFFHINDYLMVKYSNYHHSTETNVVELSLHKVAFNPINISTVSFDLGLRSRAQGQQLKVTVLSRSMSAIQ